MGQLVTHRYGRGGSGQAAGRARSPECRSSARLGPIMHATSTPEALPKRDDALVAGNRRKMAPVPGRSVVTICSVDCQLPEGSSLTA